MKGAVIMTVETIRTIDTAKSREISREIFVEKCKLFAKRLASFYDKNEMHLSRCIGALVCVAATLIIDKKWKFDTHSKVVNLRMAGATDKKMFEGIKVLNLFLSASTIINSIWDIAQNEK
jgi:hypothetical protein